jgi:transposase
MRRLSRAGYQASGTGWDMKKSRYTEEQIALALKQAETGTPVAEVVQRMGVSEQTFYRWTASRYGTSQPSSATGLIWLDCRRG